VSPNRALERPVEIVERIAPTDLPSPTFSEPRDIAHEITPQALPVKPR
jgi:hypothetical protein